MTLPLEDRWSSEDLRQARHAAELTQAELADRLGVRLWMIDQWESGTRAIPADRIEEIVEATGWKPGSPTDVAAGSDAVATRKESRPVPATEPVEDDSQLRSALLGSTMEPVDDFAPLEPELPRALRGYEPSAVHALLGELAAARDRLVRELDETKSRAAQLEEQVQSAQERGAQLEEQVQSAQERGEQLEKQVQSAQERGAQLEEQVQSAQERAVESTDEVPDFREQEDLIRDAILTAQKAANEVREEARRSASEILRSARHQAEQVVGEAEKEREQLVEEVNRLEQLAETSRAAVTGFLSSLLDEVKSVPAASEAIDADLDDVIFEHEIGKVAEPSEAGKGGRPAKRPSPG